MFENGKQSMKSFQFLNCYFYETMFNYFSRDYRFKNSLSMEGKNFTDLSRNSSGRNRDIEF